MSQKHLHAFTIKDSDGEEHEYSTISHPPTEGMSILWTLIALGGEPLARLAQSVIADALQAGGEEAADVIEVVEDEVKISDRMMSIIGDIELNSIDFTGAARDLRLVMSQLPLNELVHKLLKYTTRDGKPLTSKTNFDQAYTANYFEMLNACWRVIASNGFLPQLVTSMIA